MKLGYVALALVACKGKAADRSAPAGSAAPISRADAALADAAAPDAAWDGKGPRLLSAGFTSPESVLHDADGDVYLVSNVNGAPTATDDNGYISRLSVDGTILDARWIDGATEGIKLDAPKGMAIAAGTLYVADIAVVRTFDAKTGAAKGEIAIAGATFLNDIAPAPAGGVYVTDSGLDGTFAPTGSDAVYLVAGDGKVTTVIKNKSLGAPNGVAVDADGTIWVVTFKSGELFSLDAKGKKQVRKRLPKGQLDGIVGLDNGDFLVSSWDGESIYRGMPDGPWQTVLAAVRTPADIGFDRKRRRLLVPIFESNSVLLQSFQ